MTVVTLANWESSPQHFPEPAAIAPDLVDTATAALLAPPSRPAHNQSTGQPT
jgi:hypothetical protein